MRKYAFCAVSELILEVVEGPDAGKRVVVDRPIVIGRDPAAGFVLADHEVSRRHLQLTPTGDYVTVEDLGSANGTFVNRNELHGPARLDAGDELLAGVTVMQLRDRQQVQARHSAVIAVPQGLATAPRTPAYADPQKVTADLHAEQGNIPELEKFLDVRVRRRAVNAPWLLAVLVALVVAAYFVTRTTTSAVASGPVAGWIYVDANTPTPNQNAVAAIPYTTNGGPLVAQAKLYPTNGSGTPLVLPLPNSVGTTSGDHQVLLSPDHTLLFAVNQGSNSIAVFHVNSQTGALTPVAGSPFSAHGLAPMGLGYSNGILIVANHGIIAPFNPLGSSPPGPSDLVSFKVSSSGALTQVSSTTPDADGLIDATVSPDGNTIITSGFYPEIKPGAAFPTFGPQLIRSVSVVSTGALKQLGTTSFPPDFLVGLSKVTPAFIPSVLYPLPFGITFNPDPNKKFVYIDATVASRVAVYDYSNPAALKLVSNVKNPGVAACWIAVSKNGRFLYDSNSVTQNISVYSISSDGSTLKLLHVVPLKSTGTSDALAIDPSGKWLYVIGNHDDADSPRPQGIHGSTIVPAPLPANYLDAYNINQSTGMITEIATVKIPVPAANLPYGIDILPKG
jgi:Inner membrane component of T3SS, cytoplasmic domain/Lactonase, 7-bladed beta-propeller